MLILVGIVPLSYAVDTQHFAGSDHGAGDHSRKPSRSSMDRHAPGVAMAGYQVAADEVSAYLKTTGKVNGPHVRRDRHQMP